MTRRNVIPAGFGIFVDRTLCRASCLMPQVYSLASLELITSGIVRAACSASSHLRFSGSDTRMFPVTGVALSTGCNSCGLPRSCLRRGSSQIRCCMGNHPRLVISRGTVILVSTQGTSLRPGSDVDRGKLRLLFLCVLLFLQPIRSLRPGERVLETGWLKAIDFGCAQQIIGDKPLTRRTGTPVYMVSGLHALWLSHSALALQQVASRLVLHFLVPSRRVSFWWTIYRMLSISGRNTIQSCHLRANRLCREQLWFESR